MDLIQTTIHIISIFVSSIGAILCFWLIFKQCTKISKILRVAETLVLTSNMIANIIHISSNNKPEITSGNMLIMAIIITAGALLSAGNKVKRNNIK